MNYPCLVLKSVCKTPIAVTLFQEGISEDGEPLSIGTLNLMCNYQGKAKTVITSDKQAVKITAQCYFIGDIAPEIAVISNGEAEVFGEKRGIYSGEKARNPDGTVNYTRLDLI